MRVENTDWEKYLFSPPPWPYAEDDPNAPKAHPTNKAYGYDIRQLDSLPVQAGYTKAVAGLNSENMNKDQVKQYYSQFAVFREIMLNEGWSSQNWTGIREGAVGRQQNTSVGLYSRLSRRHDHSSVGTTIGCQNTVPTTSNSSSGSLQASQQETSEDEAIRPSVAPDIAIHNQQRRGSSTESTMTAVSTTEPSTDAEDSDEESSNGNNARNNSESGNESEDESDSDSHVFQTAVKSSFRAAKSKAKSGLDSVSFGRSFALLRIPLVWFILAIISFELAVYFLTRNLVRLYEICIIWRGRRGLLFAHLCCAKTYQEYMDYARLLDSKLGIDMTQRNAHSRFYDPRLLEHITFALRRARSQVERLERRESISKKRQRNTVASTYSSKAYKTAVVLCDLLQQGSLRANAGGWENRELWSRAYSGTTRVVEEYVEEAVRSLDCIRSSRILPAREKLAFFRQTAKHQGRMALCLSGGAAMGWKHLGVARCLLDEARLPRVISGTSAGSVVAAMLATHTDDELRKIIRPEFVKYMTACQGSSSLKLWRWLTKGHYFDAVEWVPRAQVFSRGNLTFLEAFQRTGKLLNISCTPIGHKYSPPKLMNYISAPNVIIWSAVLASACLPGVMQPMVLLMKTRDGKVKPYTESGALWRDGSFRNDIPNSDLRASFNVKFTVVSQVNPHVAQFFYDRDGAIGQPPARRHSSVWRGGFIPSAIEHALKLDIRKWLRLLGDLNLVPLLFNQDWTYVWLQKFDGNITIVPKRRFAEYFQLLLDPTPQSLVRSMEAGKVATWPKVRMIKCRQKIEDAITAGWVAAYHACIQEGHLKQSLSPQLAMVVARADRSAADTLQRAEISSHALRVETENERGIMQEAMHSPRSRSSPSKPSHPRHQLSARRQSSPLFAKSRSSCNSSTSMPALLEHAGRQATTKMAVSRSDDHRSSSLEEDVWTS
ncbi:hypothetical protein IWW48_001628 [Coemansia sp. RSA 1200]|nr:hypothetical protein IWW48_001628 [Coemansia sp. RSA 1200]